MRKKQLTVLWVLTGFVGATVATALIILHSHKLDKYRFLGGHDPIANYVQAPIHTLTASHGPYNVRVYSFRQNAKEVQDAAGKELATAGFKEGTIGRSKAWTSRKGLRIWIQPGRVLGNKPYKNVAGTGDWVTVYIDEEIDDNLLNDVRAWFAPEL